MLNIDPSDESYILEKAAAVEGYLSGIRFDDRHLDEMFCYATSGGRRARPVMVLMAAETAGGDPLKTLPAAAAVELGHKASLIHDDLTDGDTHRRGRESFWKKYGVRESIVVGDMLLGKAFGLLSKLDAETDVLIECHRLFARAYETMSFGQAKDFAFERENEIPLAESMRMLYEKTAVLCEMPMRLGGVLGGGSQNQIDALGAYGRNMGLAFQILNDVNNITGFEGKAGRGRATDINKGKKTSVIGYALEHARYEDRERMKNILEDGVSDRESIREITELLASTKTIEAVSGIAHGFMAKAGESLAGLPKTCASSLLAKLADPRSMRLGGYFGLLEGERQTK